MSPGTALVTGASSGLGAEFARQLAQAHHHLVLVARDESKLQEQAVRLRSAFGVTVEVLAADLITDDGVACVSARLADPGAPISMLINNAGFGLAESFERSAVAQEVAQLHLLAQTPMELCHAVLPGMLARGAGRIINVSSVAAFLPRGTYGAAKAWGLSFSRHARLRYGPRGLQVTAVCPGFVHTQFHQRMGLKMDRVQPWMWLDAEHVVRTALRDNAASKAVSIPSARYKALIAASRWLPDRWVAAAANRGH